MSIVLVVSNQHADQASFLWELRGTAVGAPQYSLVDLAKLDLRVEANLDGLRVAGEAGWEAYQESVDSWQSGEVFAAAVLAFESGNKARLETVLAAGTKSKVLSRGLVSALGWLAFRYAEPFITQFLQSEWRHIGIAAAAVHRHDPGPPLAGAISSPDPLLRARALRSVGELGLSVFLPEVRDLLTDQDELCRFWAAWSVALLSADSNARAILESIAGSASPNREKALQLSVRRMDSSSANAWHSRLTEDATMIRTAIVMAGAYGDPATVPWLVEQMKTPEFARVAGEAFSMITGADIAFEDLNGKKPADFEAGPTEDPNDDNVEMDPDENLPWPNPQLIAKWWKQHQGEFRPGDRYLLGKPMSVDWCQQVLRNGRQRQRAAAALELAIRQPGQPLFNVAAPGFRQRQILGANK